MNVIAFIQARMSSKRLPNKVLLPLMGKTVLEHIFERLKYCKTLNKIVIATSEDDTDKSIVNLCREKKMSYFQGSLNDVLDRYYQAAISYKADVVVRITGDCPVIDPKVVDEVVDDIELPTNLIDEAKKFDTADEFINAQKTFNLPDDLVSLKDDVAKFDNFEAFEEAAFKSKQKSIFSRRKKDEF